MKKIILLGTLLISSACVFAQQSIVKDAERAMKAKEPLKKVVGIISPALTDPETKDLAQTWYVPGKAAFNEYDNLYGLKSFGKLPANGDATMGNDLLEGYDYMMKSLSLDTIVDPKGKLKTKYSKDIISTLVGHFNDFNTYGVELWNLTDYKGAYKAWGIYLDMAAQPEKFKGLTVPVDTFLSEIAYNQALAAWQNEDLRASLDCFLKSKDLGYTKKNIYDYAISVANELKDSTTLISLAKEALPLYGDQDATYIRFIINDYLIKKDNENALKAINEAIANDPKNPEYYVVLGVIYDSQENRDQAKVAYRQAIDANPEHSQANYYYGRSLYADAYDASDKGPSDPAAIDAYFKENVRPLLLESAEYLEKANQLDPENPDPLKLLENVYYSLNDEKKLNDVQKRLKLL